MKVENGEVSPSTIINFDRGNAMAVLEVVYFLHDKGIIDKNELAERLDWLSNRVINAYPVSDKSKGEIAFPIQRMSRAIKESTLLDEDGNPV